jgi:UDP-N-acetylmuramoyl-tripeptide--D-alanyl-D-alanine ligase
MRALPLGTIAALAGGRLAGGQAERHALRVATDSRSGQPRELFVALRGENFDGHAFIGQARQRGAVGALVERVPASPAAAGFGFITVDDTLRALQELAKNYRRTLPRLKVVAVTGSNGKTSTKEFIAAALAARFRVHKTAGNLNNHLEIGRASCRERVSSPV